MKNLLKNGLIIIVITILLIIVIEISFKFLVWNNFSPYNTNLSIQGKSRWINDSTLHWTNRPFFLEYNLSQQYNEEGIRVLPKDVYMPKKNKNDFWVFLFGGSAMAGMGSNKDGKWYDITGVNDHLKDKSIDGYLEKILQEQMPKKNVRVFNAAVSMHGIYQSFNRYKLLKHYNPDWIVSMDGVNEPDQLDSNKTTDQYLKELWKTNPTQNKPLTNTFFFMSNSALYYKLGKYKYYYLYDRKMKNKHDSLNINRNFWFNVQSKPISYKIEDVGLLQTAIKTFQANLAMFEEYLIDSKQNHLLLIQPFLAFRDTNKLDTIERGVYNYFTINHNLPNKNKFLTTIYKKANNNHKQVYTMQDVHSWKEWVFVDYCHFTSVANRKIANEIGKYILSKGEYKPFKKNVDTLTNKH